MVKHLLSPIMLGSMVALSSFSCNLAHANQSDATKGKSRFIRAKLIENQNSAKPRETAIASRLEDWAYMSYVVDKAGKVQDVVILASGNKRAKAKTSIEFVENFQYQNALYDGEAVNSRKRFLLRHLKTIGAPNEGLTPGFYARYEKILNQLRAKQYETALETLKDLEVHNAKNLSEQALSAWLHSLYYYSVQNWPAYGDALETATLLREYLPTKQAIKSTQNLFEYQKFKKHYAEAAETLKSMAGIEGAELDEVTYFAMLKPLLVLMKQTATVSETAELTRQYPWARLLFRNRADIQVLKGALNKVQLRCDNGWQVLDPSETITVTVPKGWRGCELLIAGGQGSRFSIRQSGELL